MAETKKRDTVKSEKRDTENLKICDTVKSGKRGTVRSGKHDEAKFGETGDCTSDPDPKETFHSLTLPTRRKYQFRSGIPGSMIGRGETMISGTGRAFTATSRENPANL